MSPFPYSYPLIPLARKHAPVYTPVHATWESYRDWLRDDFDFRCAYCLERERWRRVKAGFAIDHIVPRARCGALLDYTNLAYACVNCNSEKSDKPVPHPDQYAYGKCVRVDAQGVIHANSPEGEMLIESLNLDSDELTDFRRDRIRYLQHLAATSPEDFRRKMSYPDELPDLESKKPDGNAKPQSWQQSHHAKGNAGKVY